MKIRVPFFFDDEISLVWPDLGAAGGSTSRSEATHSDGDSPTKASGIVMTRVMCQWSVDWLCTPQILLCPSYLTHINYPDLQLSLRKS